MSDTTFIDAVRPGDVIVYVDEEAGHLWLWGGGTGVRIVCATTGQDLDIYNTIDKPETIRDAIVHAEQRVKNLKAEGLWYSEEG